MIVSIFNRIKRRFDIPDKSFVDIHQSTEQTFEPIYLFVYGTLKTGLSNNYLLLTDSEFIHPEKIYEFGLISNGYYPIAYRDSLLKKPIEGEIWKITSQDTLDKLMRLEQGYTLQESRQILCQTHPVLGMQGSPIMIFAKNISVKQITKDSKQWNRYYKSNWQPHV